MYCLHCLKLGSFSWFYNHKNEVTFDLSQESISKHVSRFPQYVRDITTEVEMLDECGKLFKKSLVTDITDERPIEFAESSVGLLLCPCESPDEENESNSDDLEDLDENDCDDEKLNFKMLVDCLTDCFD